MYATAVVLSTLNKSDILDLVFTNDLTTRVTASSSRRVHGGFLGWPQTPDTINLWEGN